MTAAAPGGRLLFDTSVFVYAVGRDHPHRAACRALLEAVSAGRLVAEASVELVQEFAHVRLRRGGERRVALAAVWEAARACRLHAVTPDDLTLALVLLEAHAELQPRDAVHAATALNRGIPFIVSTDRGFDAVADVTRLDPAAAVDRLT